MKKIFLFLISTLFSVCLFAEYNRFNIPDSAEIRPLLVERWFEAPLSSLRFNVPEIYANKIGNKFQVRMEENDETFKIYRKDKNNIFRIVILNYCHQFKNLINTIKKEI